MIPFVGFTCNEHHSAHLMAHLEKVILGSMTSEGDPLYDVKFAEAARASSSAAAATTSSGNGTPQPKATAQAKERPQAKPKPAAAPAPEPPKNDDPSDPIPSEPELSGDDQ